jgi:hypothetical protein
MAVKPDILQKGRNKAPRKTLGPNRKSRRRMVKITSERASIFALIFRYY